MLERALKSNKLSRLRFDASRFTRTKEVELAMDFWSKGQVAINKVGLALIEAIKQSELKLTDNPYFAFFSDTTIKEINGKDEFVRITMFYIEALGSGKSISYEIYKPMDNPSLPNYLVEASYFNGYFTEIEEKREFRRFKEAENWILAHIKTLDLQEFAKKKELKKPVVAEEEIPF